MEQHEALMLFLDLIHCQGPMDYWLYDTYGGLLSCQSDAESFLNTVFRRTGCLERLFSLPDDAPAIISGRNDLHWIGVQEKGAQRIHVLGPFFTTRSHELELEKLTSIIGERASSQWKKLFQQVLAELPVVSLPTCCHHAVMLYYLVNGQRLTASDIQYELNYQVDSREQFEKLPDHTPPKDRLATYRKERALLHAVREGDMDAARVASEQVAHTTKVRSYTDDSLRNVQIACTTFAAICTRAAIEGGLSSTFSYGLGDAYIKSFFLAKTEREVADIKDRMYEDFVNRVHNLRCNPEYSKMVQASCDYIILHLAEPLNIELLAERLGYAKYYLSARFKAETGSSVNDYIKFARVERAKLLLATSNSTVEKVAIEVGLSSRSFFDRVFKQIVGKTPSAYRMETLST